MTELSWVNSYTQLTSAFYREAQATPVPHPEIVLYHSVLAQKLNLPAHPSIDTAQYLAGQRLLPGAPPPLALAYAGDQFGHFVPLLGDGRALLLGTFYGNLTAPSPCLWDIQLKGSGPTPFSRRGDGKAALGPMLREYIVSEALAGLGIPTTRSLAVVATSQPVWREQALPGAILTRLARSHLRVGTFQYAATLKNTDHLRQLADYTIERLFPELTHQPHPYLSFLERVGQLQIELVTQWMGCGFIHGVMNTDNMSISGETLDFGPCAFMDDFHMDQVFSAIDKNGRRYAYSQQPAIALWNLSRFAQTLLPILDENKEFAISEAQRLLSSLEHRLSQNLNRIFCEKLGLTYGLEDDELLIAQLFALLESTHSDFTLFFRYLTFACYPQRQHLAIPKLFIPSENFNMWFESWQHRLDKEPTARADIQARMLKKNPDVIARNHHVAKVIAAAQHSDYHPLHQLLAALENPFPCLDAQQEQLRQKRCGLAEWLHPPREHERVVETFCGT